MPPQGHVHFDLLRRHEPQACAFKSSSMARPPRRRPSAPLLPSSMLGLTAAAAALRTDDDDSDSSAADALPSPSVCPPMRGTGTLQALSKVVERVCGSMH